MREGIILSNTIVEIKSALEKNGHDVHHISGREDEAIWTTTERTSYYFFDEDVHVKMFITPRHDIKHKKKYVDLEGALKYIERYVK